MENDWRHEIKNVYSMRCNLNGPLFCGICESCKLLEKINLTKPWFVPLSKNSKCVFLERLILLSDNTHRKLASILGCLQSKDYQYADSTMKMMYENDLQAVNGNTNHSLNMHEIEELINQQYMSWYVNSSEWTKVNFIMELLKLCPVQMVKSTSQFILKMTMNEESNNASFVKKQVEEPEHNLQPTLDFTEPLFRKRFERATAIFDSSRIEKCNSAPLLRPKSALKSTSQQDRKKRIFSAKERITFKDIPITIDRDEREDVTFCPLSRASSRLSKQPSKTVFVERIKSASRCMPIRTPSETQSSRCENDDHGDDIATLLDYDDDTDIDDHADIDDNEKLDFIRSLPIQISKRILALLCDADLSSASMVSDHWKYLAAGVKEELALARITKEDVKMMQPASGKVAHPCYARKVPVHVPRLNAENNFILNCEGNHVDVELLDDEFADLSLQECYDGYETEKIVLDEKNIMCGSYNVLVADPRRDTRRHIHCCQGDWMAYGSRDRTVRLRDVNTGKTIRTIRGHSGSVKCVYIDEENGYVVSGSYDTTVRVWEMATGKCKFIFRGHRGSIIALAGDKNTVVSSSIDSRIKVWNLQTNRCKRTFNSKRIVRCLQFTNGMVFAGGLRGMLNVWDVVSGTVKKKFTGHCKGITCIRLFERHIVTGSFDGTAILWSNVGNFTGPLKTYVHPKEVLCLEVLCCRIITGCADGKIRLWNMLNGDCLRLLPGNSKNQPIRALYATENRLVVNTRRCVLAYHFCRVNWDYSAPRNKLHSTKIVPDDDDNDKIRRAHSYERAFKLQVIGSPLHKTFVYSNDHEATPSRIFNSRPQSAAAASVLSGLDNTRSKSAISRGHSSIDQHISRIQNANIEVHKSKRTISTNSINPLMKNIMTRPFSGEKTISMLNRNAQRSHHVVTVGSAIPLTINSSPSSFSGTRALSRARCRSAPLKRVVDLPRGERGFFSSSAEWFDNFGSSLNKMVFKPDFSASLKSSKAL